MNRRQLLGGLGIVAASAACGHRPPNTQGAAKGRAALADNTVKLRVGVTGLCAFIKDGTGFYQAGLFDPTGVKDPANVNFRPHRPKILIDSAVVTGGTTLSGAALSAYRLMTDLTSFQMWPLDGLDVEIAGLPTRPTTAALGATIPIRQMYNKSIPTDWHRKAWVQSMVTMKGGQLFSAVPRQWPSGRQNARWKLTAESAANGTYWDMLPDISRLLSDTVEYHTRVPANPDITLIKRSDLTQKTVIPTRTMAATGLEIWVINESDPNDHTAYEMSHRWELHQVRAFYKLFDGNPPTTFLVPTAHKETYPGSDPIFCPPVEG